jgi:hypothetical protein
MQEQRLAQCSCRTSCECKQAEQKADSAFGGIHSKAERTEATQNAGRRSKAKAEANEETVQCFEEKGESVAHSYMRRMWERVSPEKSWSNLLLWRL